jgi:hypothetical protein
VDNDVDENVIVDGQVNAPASRSNRPVNVQSNVQNNVNLDLDVALSLDQT